MATKKLRRSTAIGRIVAATATLGLVAGLAACGGGSSDTATSTGGSGSPSASDVTGDLNILVSSADASDKAFGEVIDAFNAKYPNAKATLNSVPNDTYPTTKSAQLTAGKVDVFVVKTFREMPDYAQDSVSEDVQLAQSGGLVDLTDQAFMKNYTQSVLDSQAIGGKQYAVPTGTSYVTGVYYNKKIFSDNGIEAPTTWSELQAATEKLEKAGVTAFGIGGKDTWPAGLVMLGAVGSEYPTAADKQATIDGLWNQSVSLTSGKPLDVLKKTQWVFEHAQKNFSGAGYDDMPAAFARGEFAMLPDGTWNQPTIATAVNDQFEIGYFPFPGSDNAADNKYLNGKIELQLAVSASSKNQAAALAFLDLFSQKDTYTKFVETSGFSSAQPDIDQSDFLNSIADQTSQFEPVWESLWIANPNAGDDASFPFNYPALKPLGSSDAAGAAAAAESAWTKAF
ncbi:ABC transporter substrate-binding protein [Rarobacter incanus]|uniref:Carbohydrate ABC transporter substrate-binding protein (CUT1 family) n=1 Tax=Rarobacter incanus TaxID=153494 RepID=A0A542SQP3_9MICO|nr:extracellular solute-binding protein [Rarobacter incanus]TQK76517.1 carbohydrate ABC transporter substrate-binding protein (CUT1 family) [Rarobacter incanus]